MATDVRPPIGLKEEAAKLAALHWWGERTEPFRTLAISVISL
jgi:hypothetical protein